MKFNPNNTATYPKMVSKDLHDKMTKRIFTLLNGKSSTTITRKRDGKEFIVACTSGKTTAGDDTWFLYEGCDLVIGDITLNHLVTFLLNEMA